MPATISNVTRTVNRSSGVNRSSNAALYNARRLRQDIRRRSNNARRRISNGGSGG